MKQRRGNGPGQIQGVSRTRVEAAGRQLRGVGGHGGVGMPATELLVVMEEDDKS